MGSRELYTLSVALEMSQVMAQPMMRRIRVSSW
jgi:hypothetical protein